MLQRQEQLCVIDNRYFNIISMDEIDITIQSKNTGHYWYLHSTGLSGDNAYVVYHKHRYNHPYHHHGYGNSLKQAIGSIQSHDTWLLKGKNHNKS